MNRYQDEFRFMNLETFIYKTNDLEIMFYKWVQMETNMQGDKNFLQKSMDLTSAGTDCA